MDHIIEIKEVLKKYEDFTAVDHLNLNIKKGSFFGLLGPNGAGKTTLIKMLVGLLRPNSGDIFIKNQKMTRDNVFLKTKMGIVPQHINLDKELSVKENLIFSAKLYKLKRDPQEKRVEELLAFSELKPIENKLSKNLSGGMQRKLMIVKALINDPEIIFLDEPTVGIDVNTRRKIWDMLKGMKDMGKTIILTTHYIEEAEYLCDQIALMDKGKIFHLDTSKHLKSNLGTFTVEYFNDAKVTEYKYFQSIEDAKQYTHALCGNYILRDTNLEDVFYNFTNRKVR
ncbi:ABC transporter ATP-binding protein [Marinisporobacter balticus]|uniref:ABC-2 type transport system ATP-binding protein n=1 Tax=Marinisporobacter balticus TaxID=2018667 RepID=A0A4R2KF36_9FIRM|nr:ABC transporter ATP-binding protein [Marinisporobacter balticus]TCO72281.1 ABC-2 type transport system ATP-binding protein [Marinisporobacter balticus]